MSSPVNNRVPFGGNEEITPNASDLQRQEADSRVSAAAQRLDLSTSVAVGHSALLQDFAIHNRYFLDHLNQWIEEAPGNQRGSRCKAAEIISQCYRAKKEELRIEGLEIGSLPSVIQHMVWLKSFKVTKAGLVQVPLELGELTALKRIDLSDNQLEELPLKKWEMKELETLLLANNRLRRLPSWIGDLKALREFSVQGNQLRHIPDEMGNCSELRNIYLGGNFLRSLPAVVGRWHQAGAIDLSKNQLEDLPAEIEQWQALYYLNLSENHLTKLPLQLSFLKELSELDILSNLFMKVPDFPPPIALTFLYCDDEFWRVKSEWGEDFGAGDPYEGAAALLRHSSVRYRALIYPMEGRRGKPLSEKALPLYQSRQYQKESKLFFQFLDEVEGISGYARHSEYRRLLQNRVRMILDIANGNQSAKAFYRYLETLFARKIGLNTADLFELENQVLLASIKILPKQEILPALLLHHNSRVLNRHIVDHYITAIPRSPTEGMAALFYLREQFRNVLPEQIRPYECAIVALSYREKQEADHIAGRVQQIIRPEQRSVSDVAEILCTYALWGRELNQIPEFREALSRRVPGGMTLKKALMNAQRGPYPGILEIQIRWTENYLSSVPPRGNGAIVVQRPNRAAAPRRHNAVRPRPE